MRDNQEMATILFNSNLATADQLNEHWVEITDTRDIGSILVDHGILAPKVYTDLLVYIDSLHTPQPTTPSTNAISDEDDFIDTDSIVIPSDEMSGVDDLPGGPYHTDMSFDNTIPHNNEISVSGEDTLHGSFDPDEYLLDPDAIIEGAGSSKKSTPAPLDIPGEAFVVDLGDVEPHVDNPEEYDYLLSFPAKDTYFGVDDSSARSSANPMKERLEQVSEKNTGEPVAHAAPSIVHNEPIGPQLPKSVPGSREIGELHVTIPEMISPKNTIDEILIFARNNLISDVHLIPDAPITMRRYGVLVPVSAELFSSEAIEHALVQGLPKDDMEPFHRTGDTEFVYTIPGGGRYRVTVMRLRNGCSFTARIIPFSIASFEQLGIPTSAKSLTQWAQGLVLVTGPAGCGKSTTLATLVETINRERNEHIITIENPIETIFPAGQSQICQRQVGQHTLTQENALRGALRQDPDILMVSELRDMDSIQLAVSAAETGHLVFGTMNTINASRTIYRLIESFPADEQDVLRNMISESLRGVISQQLVPRKDGTGVVPVFEVLLITPAVANMIRKNEMHQLPSAMITGRNQGMVIFDDSLMQLVKEGIVSAEEAFKRANDPEPFKALLSKGGE